MKGNKKESVRNLHMQNILTAAERLFAEKGFNSTTIEDISKSAEYSRRTVYAYYKSKDEIYYHIVLKGLRDLKNNLSSAILENSNFMIRYKSICEAMVKYFYTSPHSFAAVDNFKSKNFDFNNILPVTKEIFMVGEEINQMIEGFIEDGKKQGVVKSNVKVKETGLILWSSISGILELVRNKGSFIEIATGTTIEEFLDYSFNQIINSILEEEKI